MGIHICEWFEIPFPPAVGNGMVGCIGTNKMGKMGGERAGSWFVASHTVAHLPSCGAALSTTIPSIARLTESLRYHFNGRHRAPRHAGRTIAPDGRFAAEEPGGMIDFLRYFTMNLH